jgi:hypothetical protein
MDMHDDIPEAPPANDAPVADDAVHPGDNTQQSADAASKKERQGPGCILPEAQDAIPEAASGWANVVAAGDCSAEPGSDADMLEETDVMGDDSPQLVTANGNSVQFFFLDALYEPAMVGTVLLIGKVHQGNEYVSACVRVKDMKQCIYIVPKPFVFQDTEGDIERCVHHGFVASIPALMWPDCDGAVLSCS